MTIASGSEACQPERAPRSAFALLAASSLLGIHALVLLYAGLSPAEWLAPAEASAADLHFALLRLGGKSNALIEAGQWWRLISATFLHAGTLHVLVNAAGLAFMGSLSVAAWGLRRSVILFLAAGLGGGVASYLCSQAPSVGASGALFGLTGALVVHLVRIRRALSDRARRALRLGVVLWILSSLAVAWFWSDVDHAAHLGGLLTGALVGGAFAGEGRWLTLALVVSLSVSALAVALAVGAALRPLPLATPALVALGELEGAALGTPSPQAARLVPAGWRAGRFHERRCDLSPAASEATERRPWCFVDDYEAVLVLGSVAALFNDDPEVIEAFAPFAGPTAPFERAAQRDWLFLLPLGRGEAYVLACHPRAADRYRPLMQRLFEPAGLPGGRAI